MEFSPDAFDAFLSYWLWKEITAGVERVSLQADPSAGDQSIPAYFLASVN